MKIFLLLSAWVAAGDRAAFQKVDAAYPTHAQAEAALREKYGDFLHHGRRIYWIEETDFYNEEKQS